MKSDLHYLAALAGFGSLDPETMQTAINELMNEGFYCDECLDALDSNPARMDEVLPAFQAVLTHSGLKLPSQEEAVVLLIQHHLELIASATVEPWQGLKNLISDVYWKYDFHSKTEHYLGDSHQIQHLIGIYWEIDDMIGASGKSAASFIPDAQYAPAIVAEANRWLNIYVSKEVA
jgi:hypothetical protein